MLNHLLVSELDLGHIWVLLEHIIKGFRFIDLPENLCHTKF